MLALGSIKKTLFIAEKVFFAKTSRDVLLSLYRRVQQGTYQSHTSTLLVLHRVHVHLYFIEYCREYSDVSYISYGYQVYDIK